jgi:CMP-N,N'-diacetyllegionaminic acid synthase
MKVLGLITARGGSKGVPRKNIKLLNGRPLLWYCAKAAFEAKSLSRLILSTEDEEIAEVGRKLGLDVPFMRPTELAQDTTASLPVIQHSLIELRSRGESFDAVCLLQPTNPFRRAQDIDACVNLLIDSGADSVISILPVPSEYNPKWVYWRNDLGELSLCTGDAEPISRRQDLPPAYHRDGSVYVTRVSCVTESNSLYGDRTVGYPMSPEYSSNIDTQDDWLAVEKRLASLAATVRA